MGTNISLYSWVKIGGVSIKQTATLGVWAYTYIYIYMYMHMFVLNTGSFKISLTWWFPFETNQTG